MVDIGTLVGMKGYARKNKRMQLNIKYRWRGMAKSNTRKLNGRKKSEVTECLFMTLEEWREKTKDETVFKFD